MQLWERAVARDREAAEWLVRAKVHDETVPEIAADVGQPVDRKRRKPRRRRRRAAR